MDVKPLINDILKEVIFEPFVEETRINLEKNLQDCLTSWGFESIITTNYVNGRLEGKVFIRESHDTSFREISFDVAPMDGET